MFGTVLVLLDATPTAEAAIPFAADEARRHGCPLVLIHVIPLPEPPTARASHGGPSVQPPPWPIAEVEQAKREAHAYLQRVIYRYNLPEETTRVTLVGEPFRQLLTEIETRPAPLVVIAASPTGALGEVTRRLLRSGAAPVLRVDPSHLAQTMPTQDSAISQVVASSILREDGETVC
ncbi:MAG TPA: universal stress protein [Thermomicrobiales bacterium]